MKLLLLLFIFKTVYSSYIFVNLYNNVSIRCSEDIYKTNLIWKHKNRVIFRDNGIIDPTFDENTNKRYEFNYDCGINIKEVEEFDITTFDYSYNINEKFVEGFISLRVLRKNTTIIYSLGSSIELDNNSKRKCYKIENNNIKEIKRDINNKIILTNIRKSDEGIYILIDDYEGDIINLKYIREVEFIKNYITEYKGKSVVLKTNLDGKTKWWKKDNTIIYYSNYTYIKKDEFFSNYPNLVIKDNNLIINNIQETDEGLYVFYDDIDIINHYVLKIIDKDFYDEEYFKYEKCSPNIRDLIEFINYDYNLLSSSPYLNDNNYPEIFKTKLYEEGLYICNIKDNKSQIVHYKNLDKNYLYIISFKFIDKITLGYHYENELELELIPLVCTINNKEKIFWGRYDEKMIYFKLLDYDKIIFNVYYELNTENNYICFNHNLEAIYFKILIDKRENYNVIEYIRSIYKLNQVNNFTCDLQTNNKTIFWDLDDIFSKYNKSSNSSKIDLYDLKREDDGKLFYCYDKNLKTIVFILKLFEISRLDIIETFQSLYSYYDIKRGAVVNKNIFCKLYENNYRKVYWDFIIRRPGLKYELDDQNTMKVYDLTLKDEASDFICYDIDFNAYIYRLLPEYPKEYLTPNIEFFVGRLTICSLISTDLYCLHNDKFVDYIYGKREYKIFSERCKDGIRYIDYRFTEKGKYECKYIKEIMYVINRGENDFDFIKYNYYIRYYGDCSPSKTNIPGNNLRINIKYTTFCHISYIYNEKEYIYKIY